MLAALGGVALAFDAPGRQSLTFQMVGPRELPNAVALNSGLFNGSRLSARRSPASSSRRSEPGCCFVLNAVSFLAVLTALALVREEELLPVATDRDRDDRRWNLRRRDRLSHGTTRSCDSSSASSRSSRPSASTSTCSCRSSRPTRCTSGPRDSVSCPRPFGAGALVGALVDGDLPARELALFAIGAGGFGVLAMRSPPCRTPPRRFVLFGIGISFTLFTANANALVQLSAPDHLRGRLIGLYLFAFLGLAPVGGLFAGSLADIGGTGLAFTVAGLTSLATIGVASTLRSRTLEPTVDTPGSPARS